MSDLPATLELRDGRTIRVREALQDDLRPLQEAFNRILLAGEGYPQAGPIDFAEFLDYWVEGKRAVVVAHAEDGTLAGSYFLKPNGYGRAAHVANAGYFVTAAQRGNGVGEALVRLSMQHARGLGFDALQFNFVFDGNPARRLYERLGFQAVGRIPRVIDGEDVLVYWRSLED